MKTQEIEARIMRRVIRDALAAGYSLGVHDGEETTISCSKDAKAIFAALRTTDDDHMLFYKYGKPGPVQVGFVRFVYGNGPDVICDYTTNLEELLAGANALAERLDLEEC